MDKQNSEGMTGDPWYNTSICNKLHGKKIKGFFGNERTERYNIVTYMHANEKEHQYCCDDEIRCGCCPLPSNSTT